MHGIAYDELHDEIIVPVHLAGALLVFRGDAEVEDPPVRVIRGPNTGRLRPETVALDVKHNESLVGEDSGHDVLVMAAVLTDQDFVMLHIERHRLGPEEAGMR